MNETICQITSLSGQSPLVARYLWTMGKKIALTRAPSHGRYHVAINFAGANYLKADLEVSFVLSFENIGLYLDVKRSSLKPKVRYHFYDAHTGDLRVVNGC